LDNNKERLLIKSYELFRWALSHCGNFPVNKRIQRKVKILNTIHGVDYDDLLHDIYQHYLEKEGYKKYDPLRGKLSSFIHGYTDKRLNHILRKHERLNNGYTAIPLPDDYEDALHDNHKARHQLSFYEKNGFLDKLIDVNTPEDLLAGKELWNIIIEEIGLDDALVLIGVKNRRNEAERQGIDYYTYCQRLHRKRLILRIVLEDMGYEI